MNDCKNFKWSLLLFFKRNSHLQLFRILFRTLNHQYDYIFDWTMLKQKAAAAATSSTVTPTGGTKHTTQHTSHHHQVGGLQEKRGSKPSGY